MGGESFKIAICFSKNLFTKIQDVAPSRFKFAEDMQKLVGCCRMPHLQALQGRPGETCCPEELVCVRDPEWLADLEGSVYSPAGHCL